MFFPAGCDTTRSHWTNRHHQRKTRRLGAAKCLVGYSGYQRRPQRALGDGSTWRARDAQNRRTTAGKLVDEGATHAVDGRTRVAAREVCLVMRAL